MAARYMVIVATALWLTVTACGGGSSTLAVPPDSTMQTDLASKPADGQLPVRTVALADALADLAAYEPPADGDVEVFAALTAELEQVLRDLYGNDPAARARRLATALPPEERNRGWAVQGASSLGGETTLHFRGRHVGDYNMDGLVSVSDITPLGFNFDVSVLFDADELPRVSGSNEWVAVTDGNEDGLVGVSDITPIGQNWDSRMLGYRIYLGRSSDGVNITWDADFLPNLDDPGQPYTLAYGDSREAGEVQIYTYTFTRPALEAGEMLYARVVPYNGSDEGLPTDIEVNDGPHAPLKCELCHVMTDMAFRQPEGSCHLCHRDPPEDDSQTWADTPGMHGVCMACHDAHGFAIDPPESACGLCHGSIAAAATAASMPQCLGCHQTPHLPNAMPGPTECRGCHTEPPDVPGGEWDTAPGQHASCSLCHGEHVFTVPEPNSVCELCHSDKFEPGHAGGSTDCLGCHLSPHLPEKSAAGLNCQDCHPTPPEDPSASWTDAPGDHATCVLCHVGDHPTKPTPPESICGNCHGELISAGHAGGSLLCLDCHDYPHLPQTDVAGLDCKLCHPAPPEKPEASWDDAPGQHAQCVQCHDAETHGDKPAPPESICGDCHEDPIAEGHTPGDTLCLGCHGYAHLPDFSSLAEDEQCLGCHEGYTGPGNHGGSCFDCHTAGEHPPSGGWDACANCHNY